MRDETGPLLMINPLLLVFATSAVILNKPEGAKIRSRFRITMAQSLEHHHRVTRSQGYRFRKRCCLASLGNFANDQLVSMKAAMENRWMGSMIGEEDAPPT